MRGVGSCRHADNCRASGSLFGKLINVPNCCNARARAAARSLLAQDKRMEQSWSEYRSRNDMTKTKRWSGASSIMDEASACKAKGSLSIARATAELCTPFLEFCCGPTMRIALRMIERRAHERAHSLNTRFPPVHSSTPAANTVSAFPGSPAKRNDSRYRPLMWSVKIRSKSAAVAYASGADHAFAF